MKRTRTDYCAINIPPLVNIYRYDFKLSVFGRMPTNSELKHIITNWVSDCIGVDRSYYKVTFKQACKFIKKNKIKPCIEYCETHGHSVCDHSNYLIWNYGDNPPLKSI